MASVTLLPAASPDTGWQGAPPRGERLVVVAPHPDDEVLAAGGLMRWAASRGVETVVVAVTDGEASHPASRRITARELRRQRALERQDALYRLGTPDVEIVRLGFADHACAGDERAIARRLRSVVRASDTLVGPTEHDRHPDHVAVAAAVALVAFRGGLAECWQAPTWALVHRTFPAVTRALTLGDASLSAKRRAVGAYRSQLDCLGTESCDGPVVHPHELEAMLGSVERFRDVESAPR